MKPGVRVRVRVWAKNIGTGAGLGEHYPRPNPAGAMLIYNEVDHTYFGCANWRGLAKAYGFQPGMVITFHIGTYYQNDEDIWFKLDLIPVLPPCKFLNKLVN